MKTIYETEKYAVEVHPNAGCPFWVIDKSEVNPLHPVATFYDEERAIDYAIDITQSDAPNGAVMRRHGHKPVRPKQEREAK